jgi:Ca2+-transporting ATPase
VADWYRKETSEVVSPLNTDAGAGLAPPEAQRRLAEHGPNELIERGLKSPWRILWEQLTGLMVVILIVAAVVSGALGDWKDAIAILAIVVLNAVLGFSQEFRAEKAMAALKQLAVPTVKVRRDGDGGGRVVEISARELVPGDVVILAEYSHPFKDSSFKMNSPFGLFVLTCGSLTGWHYSARTGAFPIGSNDPPW